MRTPEAAALQRREFHGRSRRLRSMASSHGIRQAGSPGMPRASVRRHEFIMFRTRILHSNPAPADSDKHANPNGRHKDTWRRACCYGNEAANRIYSHRQPGKRQDVASNVLKRLSRPRRSCRSKARVASYAGSWCRWNRTVHAAPEACSFLQGRRKAQASGSKPRHAGRMARRRQRHSRRRAASVAQGGK